ncbi:MAG: hypothetical protein M1834_001789 [Cirrosporium novae-zelandiae]|nr:MAG: hypothetical protein M1834_001789 [Cirrosporium novae-zelandiae]
MSAQVLTTELSNLIQESRRKHGDLRAAAEKSLQDIKALPSTSETQLAAGLEIQLKVLQSLPAFLQNYSGELGQLLGTILQICTTLQGTKVVAVSSTAAATLQQLVMAVFEKLADDNGKPTQDPIVAELALGTEEESISVHASASNAFRILSDLCLMAEGSNAQFFKWRGLSQTFSLELVESILTNHPELFFEKTELASVLKLRLVPLLIRIISERSSFATSVRSMRVLQIILRRHLRLLPNECEMAHSLLTHLLEVDAAAPWKRAMCMEVYRGIYSEPALIRLMYALFDSQDERQNVVQNQLGMFARLASEKPNIIGLGRQSTTPVDRSVVNEASEERAILEAAGVAGVIGGPTEISDVVAIGISGQLSSVRVACIDQLDKSEPSNLPASYIYSLVLNCIVSLFEGIAKFLLPLTVPGEGRGKRRHRAEATARSEDDFQETSESPKERGLDQSRMPTNPLNLESHPQFEDIQRTADLIEQGWAPMLAACSTYLYATLDSDYFHSLVRSFQKLTHVAGLLRLAVPRDAFLTLLSKSALPSNPSSVIASLTPSPHQRNESLARTNSGNGTLDIPGISSLGDRPGSSEGPALTTRNLLCLRALLNLGIALGPTFSEAAWTIILETLRDSDIIISTVERELLRSSRVSIDGRPVSGSDALSNRVSINTEIGAVQGAQSRLVESTVDYPNQSLVCLLRALFDFLRPESGDPLRNVGTPSLGAMTKPRTPTRMHQSKRSVSITVGKTIGAEQEWTFALNILSNLARVNATRLVNSSPSESGWDILVEKLVAFASLKPVNSALRMHSGAVLNKMAIGVIQSTSSMSAESRKENQLRALSALKSEVGALHTSSQDITTQTQSADNDVHDAALEALYFILEQSGDSLVAGWELVFELISRVFVSDDETNSMASNNDLKLTQDIDTVTRSPKLVRSAFRSLQLICSDFLPSIPLPCFLSVVKLLFQFGSQKDDFNLSLTTTTFFWSVADFLKGRCAASVLSDAVIEASSEVDLSSLATNTDLEVANAALWLLLLLRLVVVTRDNRAEIRNGATQTLLRIFDACGEQLPPKAWNTCLDLLLFKMIDLNSRTAATFQDNEYENSKADSWNETAIVMVDGLSKLFANFLQPISTYDGFSNSWISLLNILGLLLERRSLKVGHAVFSGLYQILQGIEELKSLSHEHTMKVWDVWNYGRPRKHMSVDGDASTQQKALVAFVQTMEALYRIIGKELSADQVSSMLDNLQACVMEADLPPYSSDVDYLTSVQEEVFSCISLMHLDKSEGPAAIVFHLADLVNAPFVAANRKLDSKQPTFIAVSKKSIALLGTTCSQHIPQLECSDGDALTVSIQALGNVIEQKHRWELNAKTSAPWREATTASLQILSAAVPHINTSPRPKDKTIAFWKSIVRLTAAIIASNPTIPISISDQLSDEDFDIDAFTKLQSIIIPSLGSQFIPDPLRRHYASALFTASLIHPPHPSELPPLPSAPLKDLYNMRRGRTLNPTPTLRTKMSYTLLKALLALCTASAAENPSRTQLLILAQSTAPFLILRAALPLKSFIADQPLRGLLPCPKSQKQEILWLLEKLVNMESEEEAIPEVEGVRTSGKRHMVRLWPLVVKALAVCEQEEEKIKVALERVVMGVGGEFGVE